MNPTAILALISDLYAQLTAAQERIAELEAQVDGPRAAGNGAEIRRAAASGAPVQS